MSVYVAAYDVSDNGRRRRVAKVLASYGRRVQESVFEVCVDPDELSDFRLRVGLCLAAIDQFDLYPLDLRDPNRRIRWMRSIDKPRTVIFL